ncbi:MAG: hypothetical protein ACXADL_13925 [Candidatus Thorarchaeota archaeon]|jgi:hypothetical protein
MIWSVVKLALGPVAELGKMWMANRRAKSNAKIAIQGRIAAGEIDYNIAAQKGMAASLKDEFLVVWTTGLVSLHFFPSVQPHLEHGWKMLAEVAPDWFGYCFVGMYVAVFGLKGWKIFKNNGGTQA